MRFGDIPILAEETTHVAARRPHAEHTCARQKMIQGFFFDGVNLQSGRSSVAEVIELPVLIDADETESRLPGMNVTVPRAQEAMNAPFAFRLPPARFVQRFRLLQDFQLPHDPPPSCTILPPTAL